MKLTLSLIVVLMTCSGSEWLREIDKSSNPRKEGRWQLVTVHHGVYVLDKRATLVLYNIRGVLSAG